MYAIVKVVVTRHNGVSKYHHNMADICNRNDCIIKNQRSEMKGLQEKESIISVRGR